LLVAADEGVLVNTSSVNGFWASLGPGLPHTAYSAAKFAVKGFTEALIEDFRVNAPHVRVAVVMPGHIGTDIVINSRRIHGGSDPDQMTAEELAEARAMAEARGFPTDGLDDDAMRSLIRAFGEGFRDGAPMSAAAAATVILDGVRAGRWRILVGDDAVALDAGVRADPEKAYDRVDGLSTIILPGS
jgi:NAD(P)-dependent dehydrogenase (short-subunit alcohol dehydrogenase family)